MNKTHKIISLLMGIFTAISFVGCGAKQNDALPSDERVVNLETYEGTHDYTAPDTSNYLVQNGTCNYKIVIPENASNEIQTAKDEFVHLFEKATNIRLVTIKDTDLTHSATNKYISIGETGLLSSAGITIDKDALGSDGCRIETKDQTVYIYGGSDYGTTYSVYTFMQITFDYETYSADCMEIETNVKNKPLKAYDVTDIPDFAHRGWNNGSQLVSDLGLDDYDENMYIRRMRYHGSRSLLCLPFVHESQNDKLIYTAWTTNWVDSTIYNNAATNPDTYHPFWYSTQGNELCWTAHGDEAEYQALIDHCVEIAMRSLKRIKEESPAMFEERNTFRFFQNDNTQYCRCENCAELYDYYGNMSGIYLTFISELAEAVDQEMQKEEHAEYRKEGLMWEIYAYSYTDIAPAKYNASTGEWESLVEVRDNIVTSYAPRFDNQRAITNKLNDTYREQADAWEAVLGKNRWSYYFYDTNYANVSYFFDSFEMFDSEMLSHYAAKSNLGVFVDSPKGTTLSAWHTLKIYLESKLFWDTSLDTGELIDNYFNAMFKDAAPVMKSLFLNQRLYTQAVLNDDFGLGGSNRPKLDGLEYWPVAMLENWIGQCDQSKEMVARYQTTDPEEYENICGRIDAESVAIFYVLLENQRSFLSDETKQSYIDRLWAISEKLGGASIPVASGTLDSWLSGLN